MSSAFLGTTMPTELTWPDLILRLACTFIAATIIGYNRGEHGKAAGLRTTLLVCMAASVAMLQMNYLLTLSGRTSDSFVMNDLMRLPLGILTGVGFIGGGAILRRGNLVTGVTTAATLWYVTVVGLCFGGGEVLLGWTATAFGWVILYVMKWLEEGMTTLRHAHLAVTVGPDGPGEDEIRRRLAAGAIEVRDVNFAVASGLRTYVLTVRRSRAPRDIAVPPAIEALARAPGISKLEWRHFE